MRTGVPVTLEKGSSLALEHLTVAKGAYGLTSPKDSIEVVTAELARAISAAGDGANLLEVLGFGNVRLFVQHNVAHGC